MTTSSGYSRTRRRTPNVLQTIALSTSYLVALLHTNVMAGEIHNCCYQAQLSSGITFTWVNVTAKDDINPLDFTNPTQSLPLTVTFPLGTTFAPGLSPIPNDVSTDPAMATSMAGCSPGAGAQWVCTGTRVVGFPVMNGAYPISVVVGTSDVCSGGNTCQVAELNGGGGGGGKAAVPAGEVDLGPMGVKPIWLVILIIIIAGVMIFGVGILLYRRHRGGRSYNEEEYTSNQRAKFTFWNKSNNSRSKSNSDPLEDLETAIPDATKSTADTNGTLQRQQKDHVGRFLITPGSLIDSRASLDKGGSSERSGSGSGSGVGSGSVLPLPAHAMAPGRTSLDVGPNSSLNRAVSKHGSSGLAHATSTRRVPASVVTAAAATTSPVRPAIAVTSTADANASSSPNRYGHSSLPRTASRRSRSTRRNNENDDAEWEEADYNPYPSDHLNISLGSGDLGSGFDASVAPIMGSVVRVESETLRDTLFSPDDGPAAAQVYRRRSRSQRRTAERSISRTRTGGAVDARRRAKRASVGSERDLTDGSGSLSGIAAAGTSGRGRKQRSLRNRESVLSTTSSGGPDYLAIGTARTDGPVEPVESPSPLDSSPPFENPPNDVVVVPSSHFQPQQQQQSPHQQQQPTSGFENAETFSSGDVETPEQERRRKNRRSLLSGNSGSLGRNSYKNVAGVSRDMGAGDQNNDDDDDDNSPIALRPPSQKHRSMDRPKGRGGEGPIVTGSAAGIPPVPLISFPAGTTPEDKDHALATPATLSRAKLATQPAGAVANASPPAQNRTVPQTSNDAIMLALAARAAAASSPDSSKAKRSKSLKAKAAGSGVAQQSAVPTDAVEPTKRTNTTTAKKASSAKGEIKPGRRTAAAVNVRGRKGRRAGEEESSGTEDDEDWDESEEEEDDLPVTEGVKSVKSEAGVDLGVQGRSSSDRARSEAAKKIVAAGGVARTMSGSRSKNEVKEGEDEEDDEDAPLASVALAALQNTMGRAK
ncbi:hypothetical protein HDU76_012728 [Blyttiomyces sp. JEL0837]|nr:hypothetical protein HDU76_012728 [Blyttiomyces sp. JEL0837]